MYVFVPPLLPPAKRIAARKADPGYRIHPRNSESADLIVPMSSQEVRFSVARLSGQVVSA